MSTELMLLTAALLMLASILASKVSARSGIPALLLFLVIGMLAGSDGPGGIYFDNPWLAQFLGSVSLAYILFAGGLKTDWQMVRPVAAPSLVLSSLGVVLTASLVGACAHFLLGLGWLESLLLGSIVSSTDAAAVFSILRARATRLPERVEALLELESGSNDPMAVLLTVTFISLLTQPEQSLQALLLMLVVQFGVGALMGWLLGQGSVRFINRLNLSEDGLYPVLTTALVMLIYGLTAALGGNGFLAVYLAGLILGNHNFLHKRSLTHFHDGLAWVTQIAMFLILGLQVYPSSLPEVVLDGLLVAGFLMLAARPLSVWLCLLPFGFSGREKLMIGWVGLRGAAPIILATFPLLARLPEAETLFHLVFFVVLISVLLQGSSLPLVGRWLGLNQPAPPASSALSLPERFTALEHGRMVEIAIPPAGAAAGQRIMDLNLPKDTLVVLVQRGADTFIVARGDVVLETGDRVLLVSEKKSLPEARAILQKHPPNGE
jgi:potassium/hydrogen antiporter